MQAPLERSLSVRAFEIFKTARDAKLFCDAVLRTDDGGRFHVHKCIMIACSPYFYNLFDQRPRAKDTFFIPGLTKQILGKIIDYAYIRKVKLTMNSVVDTLAAAHKFDISGLQQDCSTFLGNNIAVHNCLMIRRLAHQFRLTDLKTKVQDYLMRNFTIIATKNCELMELLPLELASIFLCEDLNVRNEEVLWEVVLRWINTDLRSRKRYIIYFIKCIRFGLMDEEYFQKKIKNHPFVIENYESCLEFRETFDNFLSLLENKRQNAFEPVPFRPRVPHEVIFAIGGWSNGNTTNCVETYDSRSNCWTKCSYSDPVGPRAYHGNVVFQHNIYVIGGHDGEEFLNSCRYFDTITKVWMDIGPMHCKRCYVSATIHENLIYAMGGYNGIQHQNTAERYDGSINQWTMIAPMKFVRSDASSDALNGKVYITGGYDGNENLSSVEEYSPSTNQWTTIQPMMNQRSRMSSLSYGDCLYVLGGYDDGVCLKSVEKYDPIYDQWTNLPDMLSGRRDFSSGIVDDMIFAIGGYSDDAVTDKVEYYDPTANCWFEAGDMNIARTGLSACVVSDIPNIRDYICKRWKI